jgi:phosphoribosylformimino-5-aminoimidazole carboxamide ribotide isomerase
MLIPAIDLMGGQIVQLVQGERLQLAFDDFDYWIERFAGYPLVQLIDLDAAMRKGSNHELIERITRRLPCQVGGGISSIAKAEEMLSLGVRRVILGSALFHSSEDGELSGKQLVNTRFAEELADAVGPDRIVCGVDAKGGRISVRGWKQQIDVTPEEAIAELNPFCCAFLYTHIDKEGTMLGFPLQVAQRLRSLTQRQLIVAGGIREEAEIEALDAIQVDAVAGMAVYSGTLRA